MSTLVITRTTFFIPQQVANDDDNDDGPPKPKKKRVSWAPEDQLTDIMYFEPDESERGVLLSSVDGYLCTYCMYICTFAPSVMKEFE